MREAGLRDEFDHERIVEADLAAWNGDLRRALQLHIAGTWAHKNPRSHLHAAEMAERLGERDVLASILLDMARLPEGRFDRAAARSWLERWWGSLTAAEKVERVVRGMGEPGPPFDYRLADVLLAHRALGSAEAWPPEERPLGTWRIPDAFAQRWDSHAARVRDPASQGSGPDLRELVVTLELLEMDEAVRLGLGAGVARALAVAALVVDVVPGAARQAQAAMQAGMLAQVRGALALVIEDHLARAAETGSSPTEGPVQAGVLARVAGGAIGDCFGQVVTRVGDLDGDGTDDLVVGAPAYYSPGAESVRAYCGRSLRLLWTARGLEPGDMFGFSIAPCGDVDQDGVPDLAVGARRADADRGYVLVLSGRDPAAAGGVLQELRGDAAGDCFGISLHALDDLDGDGCAELMVGASQPGTSLVGGAGYVTIFSGRTGRRVRRHTGDERGTDFGEYVGGGADLDEDGVGDYLIGAPRDDWHGALFAFSGADGGRIAVLRDSGAFQFGANASVVASIDGDAVPDIVVAAPAIKFQPGRLAAYSGASCVSGSPRRLWLREGVAGDGLGRAISAVEDLDGDGARDLVVGAPGDYSAGPGCVHALSASTGESLGIVRGSLGWGGFGVVLASLGDLDGDGRPDFLVGAPRDGVGEGGRLGCTYAVSGRALTESED